MKNNALSMINRVVSTLKYNRDRMVAAIKAGVKIGKKGNIKLGNKTWTISKLAGNNDYHVGNETVKGTCGHFCVGCQNDCYVMKSYRNDSVIRGHAATTKAFREDLTGSFDYIRDSLKRAKNRPDYFRVNQSGEIESASELAQWIKTAKENRDVSFWLYTKNEIALEICMQLYSQELPDNITFLVSIWREYGIRMFLRWQHVKNIKAFVYDDKQFDYASAGIVGDSKCTAYTGKKLNHDITCEKCGLCTDKRKNKVIFCDAH